jgi:GNAT superfamily N-acetyltransferase
MPAVRRIATGFGLLEQWPDPPDFLDSEREYGRLMLAEDNSVLAQDDGARAIGFGGTLRRGGITHLGDLFVTPAYQSAGVGQALLDRLLDGAGPRVTFASADPRAVPLYIRYGMVPRCPLYYLVGALAEPPPSVSTMDAEVAAVVAADAVASGGARGDMLRWYAGLPGVRMHAGPDDGYAFVREVGGEVLLGPAGASTPAGCVQTVLGTLTRYPGRTLRVALFGAHPLLPRLLRAGLRIEDVDTYMASDGAAVPLDRYLPQPDLG